MDNLQKFFDGINKDLNSMVRWQDGAPVAEFWELFNLARQEAAELRAENAELRARLDAHAQHPGFPQPDNNPKNEWDYINQRWITPDPDEPVAGTA